jgi:tRNA threonylcarbamoyladenosine dehydratase
MPAIFGLTCANMVLMKLAKYPISDQSFFAASKLRPRLYSEIHTSLKSTYDSYGSSTVQPHCPFNVNDIGYIIEEIFRGRSVLEPFHTSRLTVVKWRPEGEVGWGNVVVITKAEGKEHQKRVLSGGEAVEGVYDGDVVRRVEELWREERGGRGVRWGEMFAGKD